MRRHKPRPRRGKGGKRLRPCRGPQRGSHAGVACRAEDMRIRGEASASVRGGGGAPRPVKEVFKMAGSKKALDRARRHFLKRGALAGAAAFAASSGIAKAQSPAQQAAAPRGATPVMTMTAEATAPPDVDVLTTESSGSDFMVDVIKSLGFEYVCANPGSSFRGLPESAINFGGNQAPELLTCCHEESAVAMGHGYFKAEGKPMAVLAHGTVGLQHAAMAIYNAWCDRVPVYIIIGNYNDAAIRRPAEWYHGVQDAAG